MKSFQPKVGGSPMLGGSADRAVASVPPSLMAAAAAVFLSTSTANIPVLSAPPALAASIPTRLAKKMWLPPPDPWAASTLFDAARHGGLEALLFAPDGSACQVTAKDGEDHVVLVRHVPPCMQPRRVCARRAKLSRSDREWRACAAVSRRLDRARSDAPPGARALCRRP